MQLREGGSVCVVGGGGLGRGGGGRGFKGEGGREGKEEQL